MYGKLKISRRIKHFLAILSIGKNHVKFSFYKRKEGEKIGTWEFFQLLI